MKFKVIDTAIPEFGGIEGEFEGTMEECQDYITNQGNGFGYSIVPIDYETADRDTDVLNDMFEDDLEEGLNLLDEF